MLFVAPSVGSADRVPQAVPVDDTEGGEQDLALAEAFSRCSSSTPGERRFPLDIQDAIADDRVQICRKAVGDDNCAVVENAAEIDANQDYLTLEEAPGTPRGGNDTSAIYYHVSRPDGDERVYVDYWWFYSRNPSPVADKVFCGPGFRWPPYTCQEHAGDWEGLTVVLAPCTDCEPVGDESLAPEEVRYGQHAHVVAYDWDETLVPLWSRWACRGRPRSSRPGTRSCSRPSRTPATIAIAFVARNSHASYPSPCFGELRADQTRELPEAVHNGAVPWAHNEECDGVREAAPADSGGRARALERLPGPLGRAEVHPRGRLLRPLRRAQGPVLPDALQGARQADVEEICLEGRRPEIC